MYILTLKEGRQPTTWEETIQLLPFRTNRLRCLLGPGGKEGQQDFRWVEHVMLGEHQTNVILQGEITSQPSATLYAYITNFSKLTPQRVVAVVNSGGRERHLIEDTFNAQKNNGIGLTCFLRQCHGLQKLLHHDAGGGGPLDPHLSRRPAPDL